MDSDSIFTMKVSKYMLFDCKNKPYFLYTNVKFYSFFNPLKILKFKNIEWGNAMITFPVILYLDHLKKLDEYLVSIHNSSLEIIINNFSASQYCVFLEFVKKFYKNKYHFVQYEKDQIIRCGLHIPYAYNLTIESIKNKNMLFEINSLINKLTYDGICSIMILKYPYRCLKFDKYKFYKRFYI